MKHAFVSAIADGADATIVRPSNWNAAHVEGVNTVADAGSAETLSVATAPVHDITLTEDCTLTLTGATTGQADSMVVLLRQDASGGHTVTWPGSLDWPDDTAPTLATAANAVDVITLFTLDGGTTWYGFHANRSASVVVPWFIPSDCTGDHLTRSVGAANRAIYVPCTIPTACTVTGCHIIVATSTGNISVGLYDEDGNRVATSGSVACPANGFQSVNFTANYAASAGRYYLALSASSNSATFTFSQAPSGNSGFPAALFQATAHPLPATASMTPGISPIVIAGLVSGGYP